ncbi:MAG: Rieske (2Fe-2S) domain protein [Arthrobacter sp.]|jgi:nitrite reductase/ring-hydroxylating ferredoxin subunit/uncharacterized membrane protein|nr:Rieske (2Fe-2S) domain protein [Arthrobacter sp.]MCU1539087.1 Rieske (2Fe-2S) domain protein [Arthrobacter sp.]
MKELPLLNIVSRLEDSLWLDPWIQGVKGAVNSIVRFPWLRDVLHGVPLGHPVHPLGVQIPLGAWTSAAVLDAVPGSERAAGILIGVGAITAVPSAVAGFTDWSDLHEQQQRVGLVHAAGNITATGLYVASLVQRSRGRQAQGKVLGYLGFATVAAAGFLGGHLSYRQAAGVNHAEDVPHRFPVGWHSLAPLNQLVEGKLERRMVAEMPLLVFRQGEVVHVLSDVCSHLSGPLHEGKVEERGEACVVCPWHGSAFSLRSGEVLGGPATARQPRFSTRIVDGVVELSLPGAG